MWAQRLCAAERGLLFLDELTTAPPAVQAAMLRVVLERVVGDVTLPPAVRVVAAANPPEQAAGRLGTGPVAGEPPRPRGLAGRRQADRARARGRLSGTDAGRLDRPPDAVGSWRSAGIEAAEALHCREMGYDLAAARELKRRGLTPQEAYRQGLRRQAGGLGARPSSPEEEAYQRFQAAGVQPALVGEYLMAEWTDDEALSWARHRYRARRRSSRRSWGSPRPRRNRCAGAASGRWWWSAGSLSTRRPRCGRCAATMTGRPTEAAVPRKAVR